MILPALKAFVGGHVVTVGLVAGAVALVIGWDSSRKAAWISEGKNSVRVETMKANDAAVKTSDRVRARAQSGGVRGSRDPNSMD